MLKVHPGWIIFTMMANAFLLYVFTEIGKMPRTMAITWVLIGIGGVLASLGILLGRMTDKVTIAAKEEDTPKVEAKPVQS